MLSDHALLLQEDALRSGSQDQNCCNFKTCQRLESLQGSGVALNVDCPMVLQKMRQLSEWKQELESDLQATKDREIAHLRRNGAHVKRHRALSKELATEKLQHGDTRQQLSGVQQDNLRLGDELKVKLLIFVPEKRT